MEEAELRLLLRYCILNCNTLTMTALFLHTTTPAPPALNPLLPAHAGTNPPCPSPLSLITHPLLPPHAASVHRTSGVTPPGTGKRGRRSAGDLGDLGPTHPTKLTDQKLGNSSAPIELAICYSTRIPGASLHSHRGAGAWLPVQGMRIHCPISTLCSMGSKLARVLYAP